MIRLRGPWGQSVAASLFLLTVTAGTPAAAFDCEVYLRMHGFLRWGAAKCGFTQYNPAVVETARQCFDQLGSSTAVPLMYTGRDQFERMVQLRSKDAVCAEVARTFPMVTR